MNNIFSRLHRGQLHIMGAFLMLGTFSVPSHAQGFKDSILLDFFGTEAAVDNWKKTQKNTYSFNHLLQGPKVAKHFTHKKFGDHLFLEGGTNLFLDLSKKKATSLGDIRPWGHVAIGDWVTPLHGWRVSLQKGQYELDGRNSDILGGGIDYLLNINALAAEKYEKRKRLEFYAVAGADLYSSKVEDTRDNAFGLHMGLRAQAYLSPYTYIYLEPRLGAYSKNLVHANTWRSNVLSATTLAGLGYALSPVDIRRKETYTTSGSFLDDTFFSLSVGPSALFNLGGVSSITENVGVMGMLHIGKWFDPYSALRLGMGASVHSQPYDNSVRAISASVGYMWNMHNTFGGYQPDRRFWINAVVDANANLSASGYGRKSSLGLGAGLQPNVRLSKGINLFLEPRIDAYTKDFASSVGSNADIDLTASLLAGVAFRQGLDTKDQLLRNDNFVNATPYDHLFIDLGVNGLATITRNLENETFSHIGPAVYGGIGKWFNATSGLRLWGEVARLEEINSSTFESVNVGLDYMWNLTNALHGYNPARRCELIASLGMNGITKIDGGAFYMGANAGLKGLLHLNDMMSLYVEPQARLYGPNVMSRSSFIFDRTDAFAALMAGVELTMNGYRPSDHKSDFEAHEKAGFLSLAAGVGTNADAPRLKSNYGLAGRLSYGNWWNPVSAWRLNLSGLVKPKEPYRYASLTLGADYMSDLTTLAYGFNPDRIVSLRSVTGIDLGIDAKSGLKQLTYFVGNVHVGGQLAFAAGPKNEIYVEPQVGYVFGGKPLTDSKQRIAGTVLLGLNHKLPTLNKTDIQRNGDFESETIYDHMFVELGAGAALPITNQASKDALSHLGPSIYAGVGKWFNATSGLRLWGEFAKLQDTYNHRIDAIDFGLDYLWNVTNTFRGYDPSRTFELIGSAGITGISKLEHGDFYVGANLGLKGLWHINDLMAIYVEPQARLYGPNVLPYSSFVFKKTDLMGALMAGVQFTMNGYRPSAYQSEFEENERNSFFSVAAGLGTTANALGVTRNLGFSGRFSFGHWYTPISAWRMNLTGMAKPNEPFRYAQLKVGADYMADLTGLAHGYNADRIVNIRAIAGFDMGADYKDNSDRKARFVADVHFGGQMAVAVGSQNELFVEPQMAYNMGGHLKGNKNQRVAGSVLLGLNHKLNSLNREHITKVDSDEDEFVSVSMGTGVHTQTILARRWPRQKMSIDFDMAYGRWFNSVSGICAGLSNTSLKLGRHMYRKNIMSLHADYMCNLLNLGGQESHLDTDWVLNGLAGVNFNFGFNRKLDTTFAPGVQVGVELGYKVAPQCEIFAEPTGVLMGKNIWNSTAHPAVLQARLMLGAKYCF